jgi:hypothetical protein
MFLVTLTLSNPYYGVWVFLYLILVCFPLGFISRYHHLDAPSLMQVSGFSNGIHLVQCFFFFLFSFFFFFFFYLSWR